MVDNASDKIFSDEEELLDREERSEAARPSGAEVTTPEADGADTAALELGGDTAAITPVRPLGDASRKRKRRVHQLADSSSDESENDNAFTGKEGLEEIKELLMQLFKKVEKNSRKLTELQSARFVNNSHGCRIFIL